MVEEEMAQVDQTGLKCYKYVFFSHSGYEKMDIEHVMKLIGMDKIRNCKQITYTSCSSFSPMDCVRKPRHTSVWLRFLPCHQRKILSNLYRLFIYSS